MKKLAFITLILGAVLMSQCKKDKDNFVYCTGCPVAAWDGYYEGSGTYFADIPGDYVDGIPVMVTIVNTYDSTLTFKVDAPDYMSESFSTSKFDDNHYINVWSNERSLDLGLSRRGNEYRLTGTVKKNRYDKIDSTWVVDRSVSFETYKR